MKKKIFALTLAFIFIFSIIPFNSSAEQLSYAMNNLSEDAKMIKSGLLGKEIRFSATDFKQALGIRNFKTLTIVSLPKAEEGSLKYANVSVTEGQKISRSNLYLLKFVPASEEVTESSFTFSCDKCAGGASIVCELKLLDKINYEPTLQKTSRDEQNVSTQKNVSLFGRRSATDPEGDELSFSGALKSLTNSASSPFPRPFLAILYASFVIGYYLACKVYITFRTARVLIVFHNRLAVARCFRKTDVSWDCNGEDLFGEVSLYLLSNLYREICS